MNRTLKCDECGAEWKADYGNTWYFMNGVYDSKQCRDDAAGRWQATRPVETLDAEDVDTSPDPQAVHGAERAAYWGA